MECELCNGSGFISYTKDGYEFAKPCTCREKMITELRLKASGISEAFQKRTLEGFDTRGLPQLENAKKLAVQYVQDFEEQEKNMSNSIMYLGVPGSGKTHLSLAIASKLLNEKGVSCYYMSYRETMTELKQLNSRESKIAYEEKMYRLTTTRLLIIDDLYKGGITDADINYVFQIVNQRYLNQLPFICSSEKRPAEILGIDEAIGSRLLEQAKGRVIYFDDRKLNYRLYQ